jgi:hypothetical protein
MPHSYVSNLIHHIFCTKERYPFIDPGIGIETMAIHGRDREGKRDEGIGYRRN